ncbi:lecithin--cholesterol acyltransferase [Cyanosarcina cf. burmensis CCALA 770]|nr:lecithin--cholesterol acyltransferase [Cyanosarcina cf. burmensis CCALA 770]
MRDMIVILPGIMGSVLQKDGIDLWNVSGKAIWQVIKSLGSRLQDLKLEGDDPSGKDIGDGIKPTRLITDTHLIPGFWKIDGYNKTSELITKNFKVTEGDIYNDPEDRVANFYHFPYDWRRDNRANAQILKRLLDKRLHQWRKSSEERKDAKVILLAHSMGGLISRYYLEVLGGWQDCRALFTFGTPYRGSVNAVNILANGFRKGGIDLIEKLGMKEIIQSLTSIHQLLPIYEMLKYENKFYRIAEAPVKLPNIVKERAEDALAFHREIEKAVKINQKEEKYRDSLITVPIVGINQTTLQSAIFLNEKIDAIQDLPPIIQNNPGLAKGDGTVPEVSAYPPEFTGQQVLIASSIAEKHGSLQNQSQILTDLLQRLQNSQFDLKVARGRGQKAINLTLEDIYFTDEPVIINAKEIGISASNKLNAEITCLSEKRESINLGFEGSAQEWKLIVNNLQPGLYRIKVEAENSSNPPTTPVNDLFELGNKSDYQV